ncbi:MAG: tetratricopeptide repeat protein [Proteobacteria bacterium]|nr:tetratricopeptide repeat protein [Pseudomonadota bacterium]
MRRLLFLVMVCASLPASAQPTPPTPLSPTAAEADRLFEEGRALAKAGDHAAACDRFARSLELDHSIGTELNLADCHEKLGHRREAWRLFTSAATASAKSADAKRTQFARERAAAVAALLTTVVVKVVRPTVGLAITIGGHPVEPGPEIIDLEEPGPIEVIATLPKHPPHRTTIEGVAGTTIHVEIPVFPELVAEGDPPPPSIEQRQRSRVHLAWGLAAGGAATSLVATVLSFKGRADYDTTAESGHCAMVTGGIRCDATGRSDISSAQRLADVGTVFAISAGALLVGAAIVYYTSPFERVTPIVVRDGGVTGLAVRARF